MNSLTEISLMITAGVISGFINTLASSGSAITLPLLIFLGVSPTIANGTNRIPILAGTIVALVTFHRARVIDWRNGLLISIPTVVGAIAGAGLASLLDAKKMSWAVTAAVVRLLFYL